MATHSCVLAWRIPGMGEPDGLPSMGSHRVRHDRSDLAAAVLYRHFNQMQSFCPSLLAKLVKTLPTELDTFKVMFTV